MTMLNDGVITQYILSGELYTTADIRIMMSIDNVLEIHPITKHDHLMINLIYKSKGNNQSITD